MNRRFSRTVSSLAIAAMLFVGPVANAQSPGGCDSGPGAYPVAQEGCASCNTADSSFGYPAADTGSASGCRGGCGHGGWGHHGGHFRSQVNHLSQIHRRDFARNQAWPKPFACADRQLYHCIWNPMIQSGVRWNCIFTAQHFDPETNELNSSGLAKIQGIFRNSPLDQKIALVQTGGNERVVDMRLENLRNVIDQWYGPSSFVEVAKTGEYPGSFAGNRAETINFQYGEQTPPPVIPVASGTGSTSDVGVGQ